MNAGRLGWQPADTLARLRLFADSYGLDAEARHEMFEIVDVTMANLGGFLRRKVAAGDVNFTAMWNDFGGKRRYDRLKQWWAEHRHHFRAALVSSR